MYLILATEERINYKYDNGIGDIVAQYETAEAAALDIAKFTPAAVANVKFYDDNDQLLGEYTDLVFEGSNVYPLYDGDPEQVVCYACQFRLREKSEIEKRVGTLEDEMTEVQEVLVEG